MSEIGSGEQRKLDVQKVLRMSVKKRVSSNTEHAVHSAGSTLSIQGVRGSIPREPDPLPSHPASLAGSGSRW